MVFMYERRRIQLGYHVCNPCSFFLIVLLPFASAQAGVQPEAESMPELRIDEAIVLMNNFAERTGPAYEIIIRPACILSL